MLKKLNVLLNIVIGSSIGVFIGSSIYTYWDYKTHPGIYEITSFPWYTSIQVQGCIIAVVVLIAILLKLLIRRKII